jgi:hypothetical protein
VSLLARDAGAVVGRRGIGRSEAATGLRERDGDGRRSPQIRVAVQRVAECRAADERDGGESLAESARDEDELDGTERVRRRVDLERAELDERVPQCRAGVRRDEAVVSGLTRDQLTDALGEPDLFVGQLEIDPVTPAEAPASGRR